MERSKPVTDAPGCCFLNLAFYETGNILQKETHCVFHTGGTGTRDIFSLCLRVSV